MKVHTASVVEHLSLAIPISVKFAIVLIDDILQFGTHNWSLYLVPLLTLFA